MMASEQELLALGPDAIPILAASTLVQDALAKSEKVAANFARVNAFCT